MRLRSCSFAWATRPVPDPSEMPRALASLERLAESAAVQTRRLTLDESQNLVAESTGMLLNKTPWHMPITEKPVLGTTEIWELVNLTDDTHPIHLHLVRFQILDRRRFDAFQYMTQNTLRYVGPVMPPDPNEMGWKDTVRVNAKTVTRIIVPFVGIRRPLCLALPHPRARGQRDDAAVRGRARLAARVAACRAERSGSERRDAGELGQALLARQ